MRSLRSMILTAITLLLVTFAHAQDAVQPPANWRIPAGTFPLTDEPTTLRVFAPASTLVDLTTSGFTQWYETQTGVEIDWMLAPSGQDTNQALNLLIASGDYPDVIMASLSPSQQILYGQQGILLPLNDLIEQYGTQVKQIFETYPAVAASVTTPDGIIYGLPEVNECYHCSMSQKLWIYKPWLDNLGIDMPSTTEEFRAALQAFKTQDPNGNGQADEIPLSGATGMWQGSIDSYLMNAFTLNPLGTPLRVALEDGQVTPSFTKPEFRKGMRYIHSLYADGLMAPEALTQTPDQLLAQGLSEPVTVGAVSAAVSGAFTEWNTQRNAQYVTVPALEGPEGFRVTPFAPLVGSGRFFITPAAQNPELALRFADALYIPEVELNAYFGKENINWRWANENEKSIDGEPAIYSAIYSGDTYALDGWDQVNPSFRPNWFRLAEARRSNTDLEVVLYQQTQKLAPFKQEAATTLPPLYFSTEQAQELADLEATINRYVDEMIARFTTGDADIEDDSNWDDFQSTLAQMGLPRMLEIYQEAYDATR